MNADALNIYAITALVLVANLVFLWMASAVARAKSKTVRNQEDVGARSTLVETDPPAVARILRAHANAEATIYPFLFLGLIYVLLGGSAATATVTFAIFAAARWLHSLCYLNAKQPFRTVFFLLGNLATLAAMVEIALLLMHRPV